MSTQNQIPEEIVKTKDILKIPIWRKYYNEIYDELSKEGKLGYIGMFTVTEKCYDGRCFVEVLHDYYKGVTIMYSFANYNMRCEEVNEPIVTVIDRDEGVISEVGHGPISEVIKRIEQTLDNEEYCGWWGELAYVALLAFRDAYRRTNG